MSTMNESATLLPTPGWRGWHRPSRRHKWVIVAEGNSEQETHDAMLEGRSGDFILLPADQNPNE
jgi:hypothetical protein